MTNKEKVFHNYDFIVMYPNSNGLVVAENEKEAEDILMKEAIKSGQYPRKIILKERTKETK